MAPTPVIGGPCQELLGLQAAGSGTGLSVVAVWGKGCPSRGRAQGTKALAGEWAGTREPSGVRALSAWPLRPSPQSRRLEPYLLLDSPGFCSPGREGRGKGFSWPAGPEGSRVAGGTSPRGRGKHSTESKRNHSHFHSPACLTVPQPFQDVPCSPASASTSSQKEPGERRKLGGGSTSHACTRGSLAPYLRACAPPPPRRGSRTGPGT